MTGMSLIETSLSIFLLPLPTVLMANLSVTLLWHTGTGKCKKVKTLKKQFQFYTINTIFTLSMIPLVAVKPPHRSLNHKVTP